MGGERRGSFSLSQSSSWEGAWEGGKLTLRRKGEKSTRNMGLWLGGDIALPALSGAALSDSSVQVVRT